LACTCMTRRRVLAPTVRGGVATSSTMSPGRSGSDFQGSWKLKLNGRPIIGVVSAWTTKARVTVDVGRLLYVSVGSKDSVLVGLWDTVRTCVAEEVGGQEPLSVGRLLHVSVSKPDAVMVGTGEAVTEELLAVTVKLSVQEVVAV